MQIFALQTDLAKIRKHYMDEGDTLTMSIHYHPLKFWLSVAKEIAIGIVLIAIGILLYLYTPLTWEWIVAGALIVMTPLVFWPMLKDFIDWQYDFVDIVSDKVVVVDQSSLFHQKVKQINLENFASIEAETQMLNIFPFGRIRFHLKEGEGQSVLIGYVPDAQGTADTIANTVAEFQRRRDYKPSSPAAPKQPVPMP